MAGRKGIPPKALVQAQTPAAADSAQQRAYDVLSGAILDLQSRRHLEQFTSTEVGYVPASGGSATYFLAADGTWKSIVGSGAVDSVTAGSTMVTASPTTGAVVINVVPANFAGIPESGVSGLVADLAARPTGSGTLNTIAKFTAATVVGDSLLTDNATTLAYATNKFTVAAATGNTLIAGTLNVTGDLAVNTNKFTVTASSGNTLVAGTLTVSPMTSGSVLFAGASGVVSQNNANFYWDNTNSRLGVGSGIASAPTNPFTVKGPGVSDMVSIQNTNAAQWSTYVCRDAGGTVRTAFGYGNASTPDTPRNARAHWWAESGTDFVVMAGGAVPGTTLMFIKGSNGNVNIGTTLGDPGFKLRVEGSTASTSFTVNATTAQGVITNSTGSNSGSLNVKNLDTGGSSSVTFIDASGPGRGGVGYGGSTMSAPVAHLATKNFLLSTNNSSDWVFANLTRSEVTVGMTTGSTYIEQQNGSSAAVSSSNTGRLRYNTTGQKYQASLNAAAYVDVLVSSSAAVGVANTIPKWTSAVAQGISLLTDDGTTFAINTNKFTVTEASGNTLVAGTLGVTGLATLTGGFTLGADSSANTHKITSLTNGSSAQDAAAFGQLATAVNAAVSGTANTIAKFTGTNVVGNSSVTDDGTTVSAGVGETGFAAGAPKLLSALATGAPGLAIERGSASTGGAKLFFYKTRGATPDVKAANQNGDLIYQLYATGATDSSTAPTLGAEIRAVVDGAVSAGVLPTGFSFITGNGASNSEKLGISSAGAVAVTGTLGVSSDFAVNTSKFTVAAATGNTVVVGTLSVNGNATLGDAVTDVHTVSGKTTVNGPAGDWAIVGQANQTGQTANSAGVYGLANGTSNTTGGGINAYAGLFQSLGTRSAGANTLNNMAVYANASGGTANYSFYGAGGDLYNAGNTTLNGDVALGDAAGDKLTFHGGTGATQQTITGSRGGNAALADLLTKLATLGLIVDSTT